MLTVKVHKNTIRKRQEKYGLFGRVARRKLLISKKNMAARLRFAKLHLNKPQDLWNDVLQTDKTKVKMFCHNAQCHVWAKTKHSISAQTNGQALWWRGDDLGLFCSHRTWTSRP